MREVNGFQLREAIKRHQLLLTSAERLFDDSLHRFEGDEALSALEVNDRIVAAGNAVAALQTAQARYNLAVTFSALGRTWTITEAIKRVGAAGKCEQLWRQATGGKSRPSWEREKDRERSKNTEYAKPTITPSQAFTEWEKMAVVAASLRAGLAQANSTKVNAAIIFLNEDLL